jgi:hypothetical protein
VTRASEVFSLLGKHQLVVRLDYDPAMVGLEIRYSYPLNALQVSAERVIRIPQDQILRDVRRHLDHLVNGLTARIPPPSSPPCQDRLCRPTGVTIVIQDGRPGHELPVAWLSYEEEGPEIGSRVGKAIRMNPHDFSPDECSSWDRLRQRIRGIAWAHYQGAVVDILR